MIFFYPLRVSPLLIILLASFMIWVAFHDILIFILGIFAFAISVLAYAKYLFAALERTANGRFDPPVLTYTLLRPFEEFRPYQLLLVLLFETGLSLWFVQQKLPFLAVIFAAYFLITLPAYIGLLGIKNGFFASLNPIILFRFMQRIGLAYLAIFGLLAIAVVLIVLFYRSGPGLFAAIFITLYSLLLVFHWIGRIIYAKREALDYRPDNSPEREAERAAEELLQLRKQRLARVFKERRRENILAVLLTHIEAEEDKLAAHAWYHSELMRWDNKRLAIKHGQFYAKTLRDSGKHVIADLIQKECQVIDPDFGVE